MKAGACSPLLRLLAKPADGTNLTPAQWAEMLALARATNLMGTLAERLRAAGVQAPPAAQRHLEGVRQLALRQRLSVQWEAQALARALAGLRGPVLVLKGAAYLLGDSPCGEARLFGDIDLLVPREQLAATEGALMLAGYVSSKTDDYDQRYYRQWMHELPPMQHIHRGSALDVHHNLLPLTGRHHPDMAALLARARPLPDYPGLHVPAAEDLLIHSLLHLVHEGEPNNGLRDLVDIDAMLRRFPVAQPDFWSRFEAAVRGHRVAQPVALGLLLAEQELGTPIPPQLLAAERRAGWRMRRLLALYHRALHAVAVNAPGSAAPWSLQALYVRGHALRMPLPLLVRHLVTKAWRNRRKRKEHEERQRNEA